MGFIKKKCNYEMKNWFINEYLQKKNNIFQLTVNHYQTMF